MNLTYGKYGTKILITDKNFKTLSEAISGAYLNFIKKAEVQGYDIPIKEAELLKLSMAGYDAEIAGIDEGMMERVLMCIEDEITQNYNEEKYNSVESPELYAMLNIQLPQMQEITINENIAVYLKGGTSDDIDKEIEFDEFKATMDEMGAEFIKLNPSSKDEISAIYSLNKGNVGRQPNISNENKAFMALLGKFSPKDRVEIINYDYKGHSILVGEKKEIGTILAATLQKGRGDAFVNMEVLLESGKNITLPAEKLLWDNFELRNKDDIREYPNEVIKNGNTYVPYAYNEYGENGNKLTVLPQSKESQDKHTRVNFEEDEDMDTVVYLSKKDTSLHILGTDIKDKVPPTALLNEVQAQFNGIVVSHIQSKNYLNPFDLGKVSPSPAILDIAPIVVKKAIEAPIVAQKGKEVAKKPTKKSVRKEAEPQYIMVTNDALVIRNVDGSATVKDISKKDIEKELTETLLPTIDIRGVHYQKMNVNLARVAKPEDTISPREQWETRPMASAPLEFVMASWEKAGARVENGDEAKMLEYGIGEEIQTITAKIDGKNTVCAYKGFVLKNNTMHVKLKDGKNRTHVISWDEVQKKNIEKKRIEKTSKKRTPAPAPSFAF